MLGGRSQESNFPKTSSSEAEPHVAINTEVTWIFTKTVYEEMYRRRTELEKRGVAFGHATSGGRQALKIFCAISGDAETKMKLSATHYLEIERQQRAGAQVTTACKRFNVRLGE